MANKPSVKLTHNFERNLQELEVFMAEAGAEFAFEAVVQELMDVVIPNLERFPGMGRLFLQRPVNSVEVANGVARLAQQLSAMARDGELREYLMTHHLLLYARIKGTIFLLSIRHQRQLSFDFQALWSLGH